MIPIAKPFLGDEEKKAVEKVIESGMIAQGEKVTEFEDNFKRYIGTKYAIATSSGTTALKVALLANKIGRGDEVITTPFSFIATANSILFTGAKPVFVDIKEEDFNIDTDKIQDAVTEKTKAILPVHLFGCPCDIDAILDICEEKNILLIEDACQAHGAEYKNKKVGSFGNGCFSFYPTKNMTMGEGGIITTDDSYVEKLARKIINHGSEKKYHHDILGYNFRTTNISAAIGLEQLKKLENFNKARIENSIYLNKNLKIEGILTPKIDERKKHVFHQYTIRITDKFKLKRDEVMSILLSKGVGTAIFYPIPIHKQKVYEKIGYNVKLPVSEKIADEVLSLPIHPLVSRENLDFIIKIFEEM